MTSPHEIIEKFCNSKLDHEVHIPEIRAKLYVKSTKIFQAVNKNPNPENIDVFASQYLNVLQEQMDLIEQYYGPVAKKERELYQEIKQVWMLCQVLFFSDSDRTDVAIRLMNWYNKCHNYYLLEFDRQSIYYSQSTFDHADFWPYTIRLILLGQIEEVSSLFTHVLSDVGFQLHRTLTRYVEFIRTLTSKDIKYVRTQYHRIQQVLAELNHVQPSLHVNYLADVLNLFMANQDIILRYTKDDILGLITTKFYQNNEQSIAKSMHEFAEEFFARHKSSDNSAIRYFLQGNLNLGIECSAGYDWWCIAHLSDLLSKKKMLTRDLNYSLETGEVLSMNARDYLILTYASYLNNQFGLWQQSFTYLMTCDELGKDVILEHMKKMDFKNDDEKLNNVVTFCINYSMKNDGLVLYERRATNCLESKNYEKALQYYSQAEKYQYLDQVFYQMLKDYIYTGKIQDIKQFKDTTEYQGIHYLVYRDMSYINELFVKEEFQLAADKFKCLIRNSLIPNLLLPIVFAEGWKLLDKRLNFGLDDLLEMKKVWNNLKSSCTLDDFVWYHYYINSDSNPTEGDTPVTNEILSIDMNEFFNTTAVIISRAMDNTV